MGGLIPEIGRFGGRFFGRRWGAAAPDRPARWGVGERLHCRRDERLSKREAWGGSPNILSPSGVDADVARGARREACPVQ